MKIKGPLYRAREKQRPNNKDNNKGNKDLQN